MSMLDFLAKRLGFPNLGLHDLDLPDEPALWPPVLKDTSTQGPSGGTTGVRSVDGPAVSGGEASAAGQPNVEIRELLESADDILRDNLNEITDQMIAIVDHATAIVQATQKVVACINAIDPVGSGVAAASVTDISTRRT